jgi:hypothetical protein
MPMVSNLAVSGFAQVLVLSNTRLEIVYIQSKVCCVLYKFRGSLITTQVLPGTLLFVNSSEKQAFFVYVQMFFHITTYC